MINCLVRTYSYQRFLKQIKILNLVVENISLNKEEIFFSCSYQTYKKIKKIYPQVKIISYSKIYHFCSIIIKKMTLLIIIINLVFFSFLKVLIYQVSINGNHQIYQEIIKKELKDQNIFPFGFLPSRTKLLNLENSLKEQYPSLDLLMITRKGNHILINFHYQNEKITFDQQKGKIYSNSNSVISKIEITSGLVKVKINQYVEENQLLVDDYLDENHTLYVGTKGYIYGIIYQKRSFSYQYLEETLISLRYQISRDFILEEKIIQEKITYLDEVTRTGTITYQCQIILNSYKN
jgi:hypothetical protein